TSVYNTLGNVANPTITFVHTTTFFSGSPTIFVNMPATETELFSSNGWEINSPTANPNGISRRFQLGIDCGTSSNSATAYMALEYSFYQITCKQIGGNVTICG